MTDMMDRPALWPPEGFCVLRKLLSPDTVARLRQLIDQHRQSVAPSHQILYTHQVPVATRSPFANTAARDALPGMAALMEQWLNPHRREEPLSTLSIAAGLRERMRSLLCSEPVLFQDMLMSKNPGHQPLPFHQDFPFWPVAEPLGGVLWSALDPIDPAAGGLCVARGSHVTGIGPAIDLHSGQAQPGCPGDLIELSADATETPELDPGDAIWFHPLLWHRSGSNQSGRQRRVWSSTWLPAQAHWSIDNAPRHPLARRFKQGATVGERGWAPMVATDKEAP